MSVPRRKTNGTAPGRVAKPYAYKLIKRMNEELEQTGCITIVGRIDRKFFHEKFYGTRTETKRREG